MRPSSESNQRGSYGHSPPKVQSIAFLLSSLLVRPDLREVSELAPFEMVVDQCV
jgi:hypothetical protein